MDPVSSIVVLGGQSSDALRAETTSIVKVIFCSQRKDQFVAIMIYNEAAKLESMDIIQCVCTVVLPCDWEAWTRAVKSDATLIGAITSA